jgi:hypothetical protein
MQNIDKKTKKVLNESLIPLNDSFLIFTPESNLNLVAFDVLEDMNSITILRETKSDFTSLILSKNVDGSLRVVRNTKVKPWENWGFPGFDKAVTANFYNDTFTMTNLRPTTE